MNYTPEPMGRAELHTDRPSTEIRQRNGTIEALDRLKACGRAVQLNVSLAPAQTVCAAGKKTQCPDGAELEGEHKEWVADSAKRWIRDTCVSMLSS